MRRGPVPAIPWLLLPLALLLVSCSSDKVQPPTAPSPIVPQPPPGGGCAGAPQGPTSLGATPGNATVTLSWGMPSDPSAVAIRIYRRTGGFPISPTDSKATLLSTGQSPFTDTGLTNGTTYYYRAWTVDSCQDLSTGSQQASAMPAAAPPPPPPPPPPPSQPCPPPSGVSVAPQKEGNLKICWTAPSCPDLAAVVVVRKTGGYPTSPTDGTVVYNGTDTCVVDHNLVRGTTYYYSLWSRDTQGAYSTTAAQGTGVPQ